MSAFIVNERVIQRIVTWISGEIAGNARTPLKRLLTEYGIGLLDEWETQLATEMDQLNHDAVAYRYKEEQKIVETLHYHPDETSLIQVLKSIHCWQYQRNKGAYCYTPLYYFSEHIERLLANRIISSSPEYKKAEWN